VPQENNLDRELTAYENLLIYGMLHLVKDKERKIREHLKMVDLSDRRDSLVADFPEVCREGSCWPGAAAGTGRSLP